MPSPSTSLDDALEAANRLRSLATMYRRMGGLREGDIIDAQADAIISDMKENGDG